LSEPTGSNSEQIGEKSVNETRVSIYEQLMAAQEQIAQARYARGVAHESVLEAMDAAESRPSQDDRREDLYLSSLSAYVEALGGQLEIRAVFADQTVVVKRDPSPVSPRRPSASGS
jgi:hypothetical protein